MISIARGVRPMNSIQLAAQTKYLSKADAQPGMPESTRRHRTRTQALAGTRTRTRSGASIKRSLVKPVSQSNAVVEYEYHDAEYEYEEDRKPET